MDTLANVDSELASLISYALNAIAVAVAAIAGVVITIKKRKKMGNAKYKVLSNLMLDNKRYGAGEEIELDAVLAMSLVKAGVLGEVTGDPLIGAGDIPLKNFSANTISDLNKELGQLQTTNVELEDALAKAKVIIEDQYSKIKALETALKNAEAHIQAIEPAAGLEPIATEEPVQAEEKKSRKK
jgi:hypothetical protein